MAKVAKANRFRIYDYGFRIYNPSIAKFLSVDPLTATYPFYTPYQFAGNNPIRFIDLDGLERADHGKNAFWGYLKDYITGGTSEFGDNRESTVIRRSRQNQDFKTGLDIVEDYAEASESYYGTVFPFYDPMLKVVQGSVVGATIYTAVEIGGGKVLRPVGKVLEPGKKILYRWSGALLDNLTTIAYKYSQKVVDLVTSTSKIGTDKEIITTVVGNSRVNALEVAKDLAKLGDDVIPTTGKNTANFPDADQVVYGLQSPDGNHGWRLDYEDALPQIGEKGEIIFEGKGAHINWWNHETKERGAILFEGTKEQVGQLIESLNKTYDVPKK